MDLTLTERVVDALSHAVCSRLPRREEHALRTLLEHAHAEAEAFRVLSLAAAQSQHPTHRPLYLRQALTSARHAELVRAQTHAWIKRLLETSQTRPEQRERLRRLSPTDAPDSEAAGTSELFAEQEELSFLMAHVEQARFRHRLLRRTRLHRHAGDPAVSALVTALLERISEQHHALNQALQPLQREVGGWHFWRLKQKVRGRQVWRGWLKFSTRFAHFSNQGMLSLLYWVLVGLTRLLSPPPPIVPGWQEQDLPHPPSLLHARRQF